MNWPPEGVPSTVLAPDFYVVFGSQEKGEDSSKVIRPEADWQMGRRNDQSDGFVFQIKSGFAVAAGRAPLLAGRRIRAASDGTKFAVEVFEQPDGHGDVEVVERVYFLHKHETDDLLRVRVYKSAEQESPHLIERELPKGSDYFELRYKQGAEDGLGEVKSTHDPMPHEVAVFRGEMFAILFDKAFPDSPAVTSIVRAESRTDKMGNPAIMLTTVEKPRGFGGRLSLQELYQSLYPDRKPDGVLSLPKGARMPEFVR